MTTKAIDASLFASLDPPRLAGSRCANCGTVAFPAQDGCPRCADGNMLPVELADRGALWTWTIQSFEPKAPYRAPATGFEPYGVGYIDLGDVIVEARLTGDTKALEIGLPMHLELLPLWDSAEGSSVVTYAFAPDTTGGTA
jgi:uncharacterized OB-fold protein